MNFDGVSSIKHGLSSDPTVKTTPSGKIDNITKANALDNLKVSHGQHRFTLDTKPTVSIKKPGVSMKLGKA